ncbi:MAG: hypothetical protein KatS3mg110_3247 [Pirellulaceae bacterium]|nr:MAG: hypothetical protein KatS3mg110_3247 [Pirellulaceae bacterium]
MRHGCLAGWITLLLLCGCPAWAEENQEPAIRPTEVIQLFNGKDLSGWYVWLKDTGRQDPRHVFSVHDGMLHISGDGLGGITTEKAYRDYHLITEWRWGNRTWGSRQNAAKDSGILVHGIGPDGGYNGTWLCSIESQIIQGGCGDFIVVAGKMADGSPAPHRLTAEVTQDRDGEYVWKKGGERRTFERGRVNWFGRDPDWKDVLGFRGKQDVERPDGEWNRQEVICDGNRIVNIINGVVVNEAVDVFPTAGKIQIQSELAEIYFRKIELHPLPARANPPEGR